MLPCRDPSDIKRTVSNISWYPDGANKIAVAYSALEFQKTSDVISFDSYIWDIGKPMQMICVLCIIL